MIGKCENCGRENTAVGPLKGKYVCFDCLLKLSITKGFRVSGLVDGVEVATFKPVNSEAEALCAFLEDFPNAQYIDVRKV